MSRTIVTLAVVTLFACGGDKSLVTQPPGQNTVPTTLTVQGGDGQTAAAGSAVPVAPSVIVRDQNNRPVAGVSVTFAVDSGGGSIQNATDVTGADGVAESGAWTLGIGRNRLRAAAGSLAPVFFTATATGELTVGESTIGTAGGELKIARPGDPLDGFVVRVRPESFEVPVKISARYGDSTGVPQIRGFRRISPPITLSIDGPGPTKKQPLELEFNAQLNAGEIPFVLLYDRATGARDVLMTVQLPNKKVLALSEHLDADLLPGQSAPTTANHQIRQMIPVVVQAVLGAVNVQDLTKDLDSGFRPGVDDWEFDHVLLSSTPGGGHAPGLPLSAAWYFEHLRGRGPLNKKYQQAAGVEWSNPMGYRMAFEATGLVDLLAVARFDLSLEGVATFLGSGWTADSLVLLHTKAQLFLTGRPQIVFAVDSTSGTTLPLALLVYAIKGSTMETTLGTSLSGTNAPKSVTLVNGRFPAPQWQVKDPLGPGGDKTYTPNVIWAGGQNASVPSAAMRQLWQEFDAGTLGASSFPKLEIRTSDGASVGDTLFLVEDSTSIWVDCATCSTGFPPGPKVTPVGKVQGGGAYAEQGGKWTAIGSVRGNGILVTAADSGKHVGFMLAEISASGTGAYNGWHEFVIVARKLQVTSTPSCTSPLHPSRSNVCTSPGSTRDVLLTAKHAAALPPNPKWEWDLGDGRTITTTTDSVTVRYPYPAALVPDTHVVKVKLKRGTATEAGGTTTVVIEQRVPPAWVFTSWTITYTEGGVDKTWPYDGGFPSWSLDTARMNRIASGAVKGGLIFFPRDTVISGSLKKRGVYMMEGAFITAVDLLTRLDVRPNRSNTLPPAAGRIMANMLVMPSNMVSNTGELPERYVEPTNFGASGTTLNAMTWAQFFQQVPPLPYDPRAIRVHDLQLTLSDSTATGSLISFTRTMRSFDSEKWRRTMTMTFTAQRIQ